MFDQSVVSSTYRFSMHLSDQQFPFVSRENAFYRFINSITVPLFSVLFMCVCVCMCIFFYQILRN